MTDSTPIGLRAIAVKYLGPTNHRGSRIKLSCQRWPEKARKQTVTLSRDYASNSNEQALEYLQGLGFTVVAESTLAKASDNSIGYEETATLLLVSDFNRSIRDGGDIIKANPTEEEA